jgi:hypothetical protein
MHMIMGKDMFYLNSRGWQKLGAQQEISTHCNGVFTALPSYTARSQQTHVWRNIPAYQWR